MAEGQFHGGWNGGYGSGDRSMTIIAGGGSIGEAPKCGSADGELGIDPGKAVKERFAKLGVDAQQLGGDDEEAEQLVVGLWARSQRSARREMAWGS